MTDPLIGVPSSNDRPEVAPLDSCGPPVVDDHTFRCAARHLVVAAVELARDPKLPRHLAARFSRAESKFRAMTDFDGVSLLGSSAQAVPMVRLPNGASIAVTDLLIGACRSSRLRLPPRSIDSELVYAAKELLYGLEWTLPGEGEERSTSQRADLPHNHSVSVGPEDLVESQGGQLVARPAYDETPVHRS